jgi:predicted GNAT family N-acyltransferase
VQKVNGIPGNMIRLTNLLTSINEGFVLQNLESKYNIELDLYDNGKFLVLSRIVIPKEMRGQGLGKQVMNDIIRYADNENKIIYLTPSKSFGASSISRLEQFYKQFGFVNKDRSDFSTKEKMVRYPKKD